MLRIQTMLILNAERKEVTEGGNPSCHAHSPWLLIVLGHDSLASPPPCREAGPLHGGGREMGLQYQEMACCPRSASDPAQEDCVPWDLRNRCKPRDNQHSSGVTHKLAHKLMLPDRTPL